MGDGEEGVSEATFDATIPDGETALGTVEGLSLSPNEHQRIKEIVFGPAFRELDEFDRIYLVCGAGGTTGAATRRRTVYQLLDARDDPPAVATQLEDFGLTRDEIELWVHLFDHLCAFCTHVVAVIEDFSGGYVWELGLLFAPSYREKVWVLKRRYPDEEIERERYANGMGASHVRVLLSGERAFEWIDATELRTVLERIP